MLNVSDFSRGGIDEFQLKLAWLGVILEDLAIEFVVVNRRGKFDMPALRANLASHFAACQQGDDIPAAGLNLSHRCLGACLQYEFAPGTGVPRRSKSSVICSLSNIVTGLQEWLMWTM